MSASDKKKLRKEQDFAMLTKKQAQEKAETKKLKIYTVVFLSVIILVACVAVATLTIRAVKQSGIIEKNTIAAVVDGTELNTVMMTYYYTDAINTFYNQTNTDYGSYADMMLEANGLIVSKPLDEQINPDTGKSWAEYFIDSALQTAKNDIILYNMAQEAKFELSEEDREALEQQLSTFDTYAMLYGYSKTDDYLEVCFGYGSDMKSFTQYKERAAIASAYYDAYYEDLKISDEDIQAHQEEHPNDYNSYTYNYGYLSYTDFLEGGTKNENGSLVYSEEEKATAREKLKAAADKLATATTLDEVKTMISEIEVNETSQLAVNQETNKMHTAIDTVLTTWLAAEERKEGDIAVLENVAKTEGDSEETDEAQEKVVNGYYVIVFQSRTDNNEPMSDVRHLLVKFQGGTTDESTGETTYTDEEKAAAADKAKELFAEWEKGETTEERFIEMVKEHSDDTTAEEGGLIGNLNPHANYVTNFLNWSIAATRKAGDTELIETEFGYHIMYYVGDTETTYRDHMITEALKKDAVNKWYEAAMADAKAVTKNTSKLNLDYVITSGR